MSVPPTVTDDTREPAVTAPAEAEIVEYRPTVLEALRETWQQRHLLRPMASSVAMLTFRRTLLGPWLIVIMIAMDVFGKAFIFGNLAQIRGPEGLPYLLFLMAGLLGWRVFDRSLTSTTRSFDRFSKLTRDLTFPLLLVPIAATGQFLIEFGLYLLAFLSILTFFWVTDGELYLNTGPELLFLPLGLFWALVLAWSFGFFTGPVHSRARDIRFFLRMVQPFWLYVTPIIYPLDRLHGTLRLIAQLNPMTPVVEMVKVGAVGTGVVHRWAAAYALSFTVVLFLGGVWFVARFGARLTGVSGYDDDEEDMP